MMTTARPTGDVDDDVVACVHHDGADAPESGTGIGYVVRGANATRDDETRLVCGDVIHWGSANANDGDRRSATGAGPEIEPIVVHEADSAAETAGVSWAATANDEATADSGRFSRTASELELAALVSGQTAPVARPASQDRYDDRP